MDLTLDVAGSDGLPALTDLAGGADHVLTIADFPSARTYGVRFSRGGSGRATYALGLAVRLVGAAELRIPVAATFALTDVAEAHRVSESGAVRGKLVLLVDRPRRPVDDHRYVTG